MHEMAIQPTTTAAPAMVEAATERQSIVTAQWLVSEAASTANCFRAGRMSVPLQNFVATEEPGRTWHFTCIEGAGAVAERQLFEVEGLLLAGDQAVTMSYEGDRHRLQVSIGVYCEMGRRRVDANQEGRGALLVSTQGMG